MGNNWFLNLMRGIWSFVIGSLRIILFLGILLFILIQSLWIIFLVFFENPLASALPDMGLQMWSGSGIQALQIFLHAISVLFVALIGCYGAFYKHKLSLKVFTFLNALNTIVLIWVLLSKVPSARTFNGDLYDKLQQYQPNYDWQGNFDHKDVKAATEAWDQLQTFGCCGITGPQDWDKYRPSNLPDSAYPRSCCMNITLVRPDDYCSKDNGLFHATGCMDLVVKLEVGGSIMYIMFVIIQLVLCAISCTIVFFDLEERQSPTLPIYTSASTTNYRKFTSSLYDDRQQSANAGNISQTYLEPKPLHPVA